jgi:hypothetical protein
MGLIACAKPVGVPDTTVWQRWQWKTGHVDGSHLPTATISVSEPRAARGCVLRVMRVMRASR